VAQRVWNVFGDNPYGVMRGQALKPQRKRGEIKGLLQLLLLLLDIFQVAIIHVLDGLMMLMPANSLTTASAPTND